MFETKEKLKKKTGLDDLDRLGYLQSLVNEFQETTNNDCKLQIEANLANFAYDPINYDYFKALNVLDIFLDSLTENNEKLIEFALGGICNFINDPEIEKTVLNSDGLKLIIDCLKIHTNPNIIIQTLTILFFLAPHLSSNSKQLIDNLLSPIKNIFDARITTLSSILEDQLKH